MECLFETGGLEGHNDPPQKFGLNFEEKYRVFFSERFPKLDVPNAEKLLAFVFGGKVRR